MRYLYLLVSHIIAFLIILFSVIPVFSGGVNAGINAHIFAFFILSFTLSLHLKQINIKLYLLKGALISGAFGIYIEIIQRYIPYREFEFSDIILNFAAALMAIIPGYIVSRKNRV